MGKTKIFCRIRLFDLQIRAEYNRIYKIFVYGGINMTFESMSKKELEELRSRLLEKYNSFKAKDLKLDMSRGKPCTQQLDLSMDMLKINDVKSSTGLECRNYGILDGIPECKAIFPRCSRSRIKTLSLWATPASMSCLILSGSA